MSFFERQRSWWHEVCSICNPSGSYYVQPGIPCFGPRMEAARIESSKEFAKQFMTRFKLPTAKWQSFTDADEACHFIRRLAS